MKKLGVILALMGVAIIFALGGAEPSQTSTNGDWQEAEVKWSAFANEHMERMKQHDSATPRARLPNYQFDMEWVEVTSSLIAEYLPNYRIFADRRFEFALDKQGHIICLGKTWPLGRPFETAPDFETMSFSEFVRHVGIQVSNEKAAVDLVLLKDIVYDGNGHVTDEELARRKQTWKYRASMNDQMWIVRMDYVGPPASIVMPPIWKIQVDQNGQVKRVQEVHTGLCDVNGDGDCDLADARIVEGLIGECLASSKRWNVIADVDHDDCITESDRDLLLKELSEEE